MSETIISDFTTCKTIAGIQIGNISGWELKHYTSPTGKGVILYAPAGKDAEDLVFKLNTNGWHKIFIGIYNHDFRCSLIKIKLSGDTNFRKIAAGAYSIESPGFIEEGFWKTADLTGQDLIIRRVGKLRGNLAYIKLIMLSDEDVAQYIGMGLREKANLGAVFDVGDLYFNDEGPFTPECIHEVLEPFVNSDFGVICWGTTNSTYTYLYHTKIGDVFGQGITDFYGEGIRKTAKFMSASIRGGWDPLRVAVDYCHNKGLLIYADYRIEHTYDVNAYNGNFTGSFQREHQHCRRIDFDGSVSPLLSLAYDEVQDYKISVLSEMAEYGVDGIYVDFGRSSPVVSYCPPIVKGFINEYGEDPRTLVPNDIRWLKYRADYVTRFMRKLKRAVTGVELRIGKKINIAAQVEYGYTHTSDPHCNLIDKNLILGYDLKTWAEEGLVDIIAPSENSRMYKMYNLDYYRNLLNGTNCSLWPVLGQFDNSLFPLDYDWMEYFMTYDMTPRKQIRMLSAERIERNASDCYAQGAEGLFLWEAGDISNYLNRWNQLAGLGKKAEITQRWGTSVARYDQAPTIGCSGIELSEDYE